MLLLFGIINTNVLEILHDGTRDVEVEVLKGGEKVVSYVMA